MKPKPLSWFLDRIGKRVYQDMDCPCDLCVETDKEGLVIQDRFMAENMFEFDRVYAAEGTFLNYRDKK